MSMTTGTPAVRFSIQSRDLPGARYDLHAVALVLDMRLAKAQHRHMFDQGPRGGASAKAALSQFNRLGLSKKIVVLRGRIRDALDHGTASLAQMQPRHRFFLEGQLGLYLDQVCKLGTASLPTLSQQADQYARQHRGAHR